MARLDRKDKAPPGRLPVSCRWYLSVGVGLMATVTGVAGQAPPDGDWRTLETPNFDVTFLAEREALGRRAAELAEESWARLTEAFPAERRDRVELLILDEIDVSNGFAIVRPARRVVIYARPPVDGFALSNFDEWLELVITHELAHIVHLDTTSEVGRFLRSIFGRIPGGWPFFPTTAAPDWTVEGLATWAESRFARAGRARGTFFEMMLRTAAMEGAFEPIDRTSGQSPQWPAGARDYLYGGLFFDHLAETYGEEAILDWIGATAGQWVPYRPDAAASESFGIPFSEEWTRWKEGWEREAREVVQELKSAGGVTRPQRLTDQGRQAVRPRTAADGTVVFARADGRSDPQLRRWDPDGGSSHIVHRTNGLGDVAPAPDGSLLVAQTEFVDNFRLFSDLWWIRPDGREVRLTRGARLDQPDLSPDGSWGAAVRFGDGGSTLVRLDPANGEVAPFPELPTAAVWAFPRISPDGRWIAATLWDDPGRADIVILDATDGSLALTLTADRALDLAPDWSPDGSTLVWGSDRTGIPQIVAARVDPAAGRAESIQTVTRVVTGVAFPTFGADGEWLYLSEYTATGWELARVAWSPPSGPPAVLDPRFAAEAAETPAPMELTAVTRAALQASPRNYQALPSLLPNYWTPVIQSSVRRRGRDVIEPFLGLETGGNDLVGRHRWGLRGAVALSGEVAGALAWNWLGLGNPVLTLNAEQDWSADGPFTVAGESEASTTLWVRERERRLRVGVRFDRRRWRTNASIGLTGGMVWESRSVLDDALRPTDEFTLRSPQARLWEGQLRLAWSSARSHALSVSNEEGASAFVLARTRVEQSLPDSLRRERGFDRTQHDLLGQLQLYQSFSGPGFGDHVLALRLAGGFAAGPGADQFTWDLGGVPGQAEGLTGLSLFGGTSLFFPVRGYDEGFRSGRTAWVASGEYRFPLAMVNRGLGLFPLHLDRVHGAVFVDAGNAWGPQGEGAGYDQPRLGPLAGTGAEVVVRLSLLYSQPLVIRTGAAVPLVDALGSGPRFYIRVGSVF